MHIPCCQQWHCIHSEFAVTRVRCVMPKPCSVSSVAKPQAVDDVRSQLELTCGVFRIRMPVAAVCQQLVLPAILDSLSLIAGNKTT
jgi:hypothetical protein